MSRSRRVSQKDAAYEVMEEAYLKASANGTLPAHARQIMYQARRHIQERTGKQLDDAYFTQTLLPDYISEHQVDWDVVSDDRGHFHEPHTSRSIGLGTLAVRDYLGDLCAPEVSEIGLRPVSVATHGPQGRFGGVLFIEKEGFIRCSRAWRSPSVTTSLSCRPRVNRWSRRANSSTKCAATNRCRYSSCMISTRPDFQSSAG